jgi:hypothetical protein
MAAQGGSDRFCWGVEMRQLLVGTALLVSALIVTFATATILQGMAVQKRTIVAEPFSVDGVTPAATATRGVRSEPVGGRSLSLVSRRVEM